MNKNNIFIYLFTTKKYTVNNYYFYINHILIYLFDELNKITKYIKIIKAIFIKNFILPKKKKEYDEIMKKTTLFLGI